MGILKSLLVLLFWAPAAFCLERHNLISQVGEADADFPVGPAPSCEARVLTPSTTNYHFDYESGFISGGSQNFLDGSSRKTPIYALNLLPRYQLRKLPDAANGTSTLAFALPVMPTIPQNSGRKEELFISGQKSFGFSYSPSGTADFQQSLSLALKGKLSEQIGFSANLSDRNLPSGSGSFSKRLDQFDQIGLGFTFPQGSLNLGDIFFKSGSGGFLNFERKISGLGGAFNSPRESLSVAFGSGPGEFRTAELAGQEGKLGAYYLGSARNFIVPGSEKVFLDGEQLSSGRDGDYEIDYEQGFITFSPLHPVSSFSRIRVEYEFQSGPYSKNIMAAHSITSAGDKLKFRLGYLGSKDKLDSPLMRSLSPEEKERLAAAGADSSAAVRDGAIFAGAGKGDYAAFVDSSGNRQYRYVGANVGDYTMSFSLSRSGPGDYRYLGGGVYEFVGHGKGAYRPVLYLPVPNAERGVNFGIDFAPGNFGSFAEFSFAEKDQNLFSSHPGVKVGGGAFLSGLRWQSSDSGAPGLKLEAKLKRREADFHYLGKKDEAEAAYRWNLQPEEETLGQTLGEVTLSSRWDWGESRLNLGGLALGKQKQSGLGGSDLSLVPLSWLTLKSRTEAGRSNYDAGHYRTQNSASGRWGNFGLTASAERERGNPFLGQRPEVRQRWAQRLEYQNYFLEASFGNRDGFQNFPGAGWGRISRYAEFRLGSKAMRAGKLTAEANLGFKRVNENGREFNRGYLSLKNSFYDGGKRASFSHQLSPVESPLELFSYLDVGRGNGGYRYENGGYVPDPYGSFDLVAESAGDTLAVYRVRQNAEFTWEPHRNFASVPGFWSQLSYRAVFSLDGHFAGPRGAANLLPVFALAQSRRHELEFRQSVSFLPDSRKQRLEFSWSEKSSRRSYSVSRTGFGGTGRSERKMELAGNLFGKRLTQNYSAGYSGKKSGGGFWAAYQIQGWSVKGEWLYAFSRTVSASFGGRHYRDRELLSGSPASLVSIFPKLIFSFPQRGRIEAGLTAASVSGNLVSFEQAEGNLKGLNLDYNLNFDYRLGPKLSASASFLGSQRPLLGKNQRASTHLNYLFR